MAAAVLLSSCVKDTLYDTPHPDYGKIAVTADWSARGEGIDIPATWTVTMGDYTGTETSATHAPDHLFAPGSYTLAVWNPAEGIGKKGNGSRKTRRPHQRPHRPLPGIHTDGCRRGGEEEEGEAQAYTCRCGSRLCGVSHGDRRPAGAGRYFSRMP